MKPINKTNKNKIKYKIRELNKKDLDLKYGFFETLNNLSKNNNLNIKKAEQVLKIINKQGSKVLIAITNDKQIVGSLTLMLEQKFLRRASLAGHIEDVVTRSGYEGMGIASSLIKKAIKMAKKNKCYKIILDCHDELVPFYKKFDFKNSGTFMKIYLKE